MAGASARSQSRSILNELDHGSGYESDDIEGVHAEDMSVTETDDGRYRMYYAACGRDGNWLIASAVTEGEPTK